MLPSSTDSLPPQQINGHDSSSKSRRDFNHNHTSSITIQNHINNQFSNQIHQQMSSVDHREVKINDIVGSGICGILYKWVNYGKGWRPRWFVLQDGVVSYYKIHGPDKITLSLESEKGFKVIGDESMKRIRRSNNNSSSHPHRRKPFGEVHLKVLFLEPFFNLITFSFFLFNHIYI